MVQPPISLGEVGNSARLHARAATARAEFSQSVARLRRLLQVTADIRTRGDTTAEQVAELDNEIKSLKGGLGRLREELATSGGSVARCERRGEQTAQERAALTVELRTMSLMLRRLQLE